MLVSVQSHIGMFSISEQKVWDDIHQSDSYSIVTEVGNGIWIHTTTDIKDCVKDEIEVFIFLQK